jgi:hypothetical protein
MVLMQALVDRPFARRSIAALTLLVIGGVGSAWFWSRHRLPVPIVLCDFAWAYLSVDLVHAAWADISLNVEPRRERWRLRLLMAPITPIAGPLYWLILRRRAPAASQGARQD